MARGATLSAAIVLAALFGSAAALAEPQAAHRNRDNPDRNDLSEGTYPVPYHKPQVAEVAEVLERVRGYLEANEPGEIKDAGTGQPITDFTVPNPRARLLAAGDVAFHPLHYTMGVVHSGLLQAAEATGDRRFSDFTARQLQLIADRLPYFRSVAALGVRPDGGSFGQILDTSSLDDSGAMCAALIKARRQGIGPDLLPVIEHWSDFIARRQFRLADGTLARRRPQPESLWADDLYMSVPALAQMGALTGEPAWLEDAVRQVRQFHGHLWDPRAELYAHGKHMNQPLSPQLYWGRANAWALLSAVELLDVLPAGHPGRAPVVELLGSHVRSLARLQSGSGLWHQMLDKTDSFLETSASAIFVYAIARAINQGSISPVSFGSVAQAGWLAVATRVDARGQVEGTCVGTTLGSDNVYYYNRPTTPLATHGYGPVLLAGAEMIRLLRNPAFEIQHKQRTYHYVPRAR